MAAKQGKSAKRARPVKHDAPKNAFKKQNKSTKHKNARLRDELDVDARSLHATVLAMGQTPAHIIPATPQMPQASIHALSTALAAGL